MWWQSIIIDISLFLWPHVVAVVNRKLICKFHPCFFFTQPDTIALRSLWTHGGGNFHKWKIKRKKLPFSFCMHEKHCIRLSNDRLIRDMDSFIACECETMKFIFCFRSLFDGAFWFSIFLLPSFLLSFDFWCACENMRMSNVIRSHLIKRFIVYNISKINDWPIVIIRP